MNIGLRVLTRPIPAKLAEVYRTLGTNYDERVLPSIIQAGTVVLAGTLQAMWSYNSSSCQLATYQHYIASKNIRHCRLQETLKSVIAQYNASQLLTMREVCLFSCLAYPPACTADLVRKLAMPCNYLHHARSKRNNQYV